VAGVALEVEIGFVLNEPIVDPAGFEAEAVECAALLQTARCALADLEAALLIKSWNLNPGSNRCQLLRHFAERARRHATIDLDTIRLEDADLTLRARILLARRRDVLLGMDHGLVVLRIVQERSQRDARRVRSARRELGAESGRSVRSGDGSPVDAAGHQLQTILATESSLVDPVLARS